MLIASLCTDQYDQMCNLRCVSAAERSILFRMRLLCCSFLILCQTLFGQHPVQHAAEPNARYYRLICLVHLTGSGKHTDPIRPEFVPTGAEAKREGILSWSVQITDDRNMAIVHLVASNRHAFDAILADKRPEIRVFEIGKDSRATIEAEMQRHKAGFDLSKFAVVAR